MPIPQLQAVLAALEREWRLRFEFLAHTGLRIGEAIEVRWGRDLLLDAPAPYSSSRRRSARG